MSGTANEMPGMLDDTKDAAEEGAKEHEGFLDKMKDKVEDAVEHVKDAFDGDKHHNDPKPA